MKKYITYILVSLFYCNLSIAQIDSDKDSVDYDNPNLGVICKVEKNKVILRWAPTSYSLLDIGNTYGYKIEKIGFNTNPFTEPDAFDNDTTSFKFEQVPESPIKPWTFEQFQSTIIDSSNIYLGVAMEMLYGETGGSIDLNKGTSLKESVMEQSNKYAFSLFAADLNREAALSLGLRYEDEDVGAHPYYLYRITYNFSDPDLYLDTIEVFVATNELTPSFPVTNCMVEPFDGFVSLTWTYHNSTFFSAYDIERSSDKLNWEKLNKHPYTSGSDASTVGFVFLDTNVVNKNTYYYRLRGYTPYGEMGEYSEIMSTAPKDLTPPAPAYNIAAEDIGGVVKITWDAQPNEPDFDGFYVARSYLASGGFVKISDKLPPESRAFVDFLPDPLESNYYAVISVDADGNEAQSYVAFGYIVDSIPPAPPTGLTGEIDTTGTVTIRWSREPEADIIGYRVYWANDTLSEFSQLTGELHAHTVFRDSVAVKTLTKAVYYKVVAVDHRYNHSEYSNILQLKRPDIVPPSSPVISDYKLSHLAVELNWINSISDDVVEHRLERKKMDEEWETASILEPLSTSWKEEELVAGVTYSFRIIAEDDAGNTSVSKPLVITAIDDLKRQEVTGFRLTTKEGNHLLEWNYHQKGNYIFVVYEKEGEQITPIAKLPKETQQHTISDPTKNYGIRVVFFDGGESGITFLK